MVGPLTICGKSDTIIGKGEEGMGEITALSVQAKDKSRCNVYVDGRFSCALSIEVAVRNRLKVGLQVDDAFLAAVQLEGEKELALSKALSFVSLTPKTKKQVRDHLTKKGYLPVVIEYVLEKMSDYNVVTNDCLEFTLKLAKY